MQSWCAFTRTRRSSCRDVHTQAKPLTSIDSSVSTTSLHWCNYGVTLCLAHCSSLISFIQQTWTWKSLYDLMENKTVNLSSFFKGENKAGSLRLGQITDLWAILFDQRERRQCWRVQGVKDVNWGRPKKMRLHPIRTDGASRKRLTCFREKGDGESEAPSQIVLMSGVKWFQTGRFRWQKTTREGDCRAVNYD